MDKAREAFHELLLEEADASLELTADDTRTALCAALNDMFPGEYAYVRDVIGDGESGDVIYCCGGDTYRASYEIGLVNGARTCSIDDDSAIEVICRTVYDPVADDDDHYADLSTDADVDEALKTKTVFERWPGSAKWNAKIWTLRERFISKAERDAADPSDFAGKGKSYPILKPGDVQAAVHAMGRAGSDNKSSNALKAAIIRIAKRKGWTKYLPKTWRGDDTKEGAKPAGDGTLKLFESAAPTETIVLQEAKADYGIKLIAPGKGSSAFYPKEVLERDGPKVFKAGTHVYLNHPTAAEEASRPEGDVKNLAGVLTTTAVYNESGSSGPGLYARMKVFADHAQMVEEKAPHVGMSIRASGIAESGKSKDGLPVLKELTSAESVDVVTKAGAGGMILTEAKTMRVDRVEGTTAIVSEVNPVKEGEMTPDEVKKLVEAGIAEATKPLVESNRKLRQRALAFDAREEGERLLETVTLPPEAKAKIIREAVRDIPLTEAGELDLKKFSESIVELAKTEGAYLAKVTGSGRVFGMGPTIVTETDDKAARKAEKKRLKEAKKLREGGREAFEALGLPKNAAKLAAREVA